MILLLAYAPYLRDELRYEIGSLRTVDSPLQQTPVDANFGTIIPNIGVNTKVIQNVDPSNRNIYQYALTKGVGHALGTGIPGGGGNIFLFSHSSATVTDALKYSSVFYLLSKLIKDDTIELYYLGIPYRYSVTDINNILPRETKYLPTRTQNEETLTLMTC